MRRSVTLNEEELQEHIAEAVRKREGLPDYVIVDVRLERGGENISAYCSWNQGWKDEKSG